MCTPGGKLEGVHHVRAAEAGTDLQEDQPVRGVSMPSRWKRLVVMLTAARQSAVQRLSSGVSSICTEPSGEPSAYPRQVPT